MKQAVGRSTRSQKSASLRWQRRRQPCPIVIRTYPTRLRSLGVVASHLHTHAFPPETQFARPDDDSSKFTDMHVETCMRQKSCLLSEVVH